MPSKTLHLPLALMATLLLCSMAFAQASKQELNDQLFEAARKGDAAAVTALLDKGADVNAKFRYGTTALFKASERGNTEVVKVLLARGADASVKDTFYGTTAITWALDNGRIEVVRALLDKSPDGAGDVLMNGVRENKLEIVKVALERGGIKADTLTSALAAATTADQKNEEIIALLKKAGAIPPPEVDVAILQSYVGKYRGEGAPEIAISLANGKLSALPTGQRQPFALIANDNTTFRPAAFDGILITFQVEGGKATGFTLKQGASTTQLKRVE